ncbi:MAG: PD40 domain-containing protein [Anaerolineae bacterium]|nr:PD40 domain-containing protein [Anaerolineae bacterium]
MRNFSRILLILICALALTLGLFATPTIPVSTAQSARQLYPTLIFEIPKLDDALENQFQITLDAAMEITIHTELMNCSSRCLFELKPTGDNRRFFTPTETSPGFPAGDSVYATYELEAGDYTLTVTARRKLMLFDSTSIQYFRIWYVPTGYKGPTRNVMSGVNPNLLAALQGTTLALQLGIGNELNSTYLLDGDTWELSYVTFNRTLIGDRFSPVLTPDGKQLLTVEAANFGSTDFGLRSWLALYDLLPNAQGTAANLNFYLSKQEEVQQNEEYAGASFSPDGKLVVFHTNRGLGRAYEIMLMDLTTKKQKQLTTEGGRNRFPSFSPDGKRIVFHSDRAGGDYQIFSMNIDGSDLEQLTDGAGGNFRAVFSPDGKYIAFCSDRDRVGKFSDGSYFSQVYVMQADGSKVRRLVDNSVDSCVETWSPDGQWIAYISQERPESVAYAVSLDGKEDYQLAKPISFAIPEIREGRARSAMGVRAISWVAKSAGGKSTDKQDNDGDDKKDSGDKKDNTLGGTNDNSNKDNDNDSGSTSDSTAEPVLIYEDNLDSAVQGAWGAINEPPNTAGVQNGAYAIDLVDAGDLRGQPLWWIFAPGFTDWSKAPQPTAPFTLLLDVNNGSCSGGLGECYVGAMWGVQSQFAAHYTFFYSPFNQRWMVQYGRSTKSSITPNCANRTFTLVNVFDGKRHQLRLDVKEESIELSIDKQSIATCEQPTDWHGTIGFAVGRGENDNSSRIQLSIDKITLYNGTLPK